MSQIVVYRQYWMAMIKNRQNRNVCGELAIVAIAIHTVETCLAVTWICYQHSVTALSGLDF
jgi:hypothetical protein